MGSVFRKDWPIAHLSAGTDREEENVKLTGPLCTSIDALAGPMEMPADAPSEPVDDPRALAILDIAFGAHIRVESDVTGSRGGERSTGLDWSCCRRFTTGLN